MGRGVTKSRSLVCISKKAVVRVSLKVRFPFEDSQHKKFAAGGTATPPRT